MAVDLRDFELAGDGEGGRPAARVSDDGLVLTCAGYEDAVRWREGERLEYLFERRCDELGGALAVDGPAGTLTYAQLDGRANRLARFLAACGAVRAGDRVALVPADAIDGYVAMLAVLKLHAVYVPLDAAFPAERIAYIASDASVRAVLSHSALAATLAEVDPRVALLYVDELADEIAAQPGGRLAAHERGDADDDLCYVIYTSGTTGRPKGVAVGHPSICNFVRVASEVYGVRDDDRVYQGLTVAFDFAVEEIWVAWMTGATLVPRPGARNLVGPELQELLCEHRVTALCCVPTLLATLEDDLPDLRFLLVSGESCPPDLVERWWRPGRRFLNVYGPTEATVSATWTVLDPGRAVTIGVPLPTYTVVILDPDEDRALPVGEVGEIGLAGIGLADGYLNLPERTRRAFVEDFLGLPENPSGRIYRTGDLGRVNDVGEVEHLGRIDTQVKIRGYRIELGEIEAVLRQVPGVAQAAVRAHRVGSGVEELVAYWTAAPGAPELDRQAAYSLLRGRLPSYMVPAHLERLEELPMMPSGKLDRAALPAPREARSLGERGEHVVPRCALERALAEQLAGILGLERVSVTSHLFDELGVSSLLAARLIAELRRRDDVPAVSMRDIYLHPTVRALAAALAAPPDEGPSPAPSAPPAPAVPEPIGTPRYVLCGVLQVLAFLGYLAVTGLVLDGLAAWLTSAHGLVDLYGRAAAGGAATLLGAALLPIAAKWVLIGRFTPRRIRLWSLAYVRFWIVKTLLVANPLSRLVAGTPLYGLYLRALGARIGRGAVILSRHVPVCTDLLTIGAHSVVGKDVYLNGYRARAGTIEIGPVTLGEGVFVGEHSVLDIATTLKDGAQLGHASALLAGQVVPAGACWHGSPGEPAGEDVTYRRVPRLAYSRARRAAGGVGCLVALVAVLGPLEEAAATVLLTHPRVTEGVPDAYVPVIAAGAILGLLALGVVVSATVPRLLTRALEPGRVYPLYGVHHALQRMVARTSNIGALTGLFGDSSAIVGYLRLLGYRLGVVEQTGSNFGSEVKHEVPALCRVGTGTIVSDGLSMMNAEVSSTSFRVLPVAIGARNYLGNGIAFPADARTGENCLLATRVLVPIAGPVHENVGLLGSPAFAIPRAGRIDPDLRRLGEGSERLARLAAKNRHNLVTMALHLLVRVAFLSGVTMLALVPVPAAAGWTGMLATGTTGLLDAVVLPVAVFALVERAVTRFRPLQPRVCSIYQRDFWRHERFWKVPALGYVRLFDGTPFKGLVWRLLGVRIGRRVFDDGCSIVERTLVGLGDDVTLNMGSVLQGHSLEDGIFKSDHIEVGSRCTVGTGAFVHYGTVMEDGSLLEADAFLMKGSRVVACDRWGGNPASEL